MPHVDIEINDRAYRLVCEAGQEDRIRDLAAYVDMRMREATGGGRSGSDVQNLLVTCLVLADELRDVLSGRDELTSRGLLGASAGEQREIDEMAEALDQVTSRIEEVAVRLERA